MYKRLFTFVNDEGQIYETHPSAHDYSPFNYLIMENQEKYMEYLKEKENIKNFEEEFKITFKYISLDEIYYDKDNLGNLIVKSTVLLPEEIAYANELLRKYVPIKKRF